jgi:two-component system, chemotaxis family, sensor histidine kinase and response regulator PixL
MLVSKKVLCVDDNNNHNELLKTFFEQAGFKVITCNTPGECLHYIKTIGFSAIIPDSWLENTIGVQVFQIIKNLYPQRPLIFFTDDKRTKSREIAMTIGASAYPTKPDNLDNIVSTVGHLIDFSNFSRALPNQV